MGTFSGSLQRPLFTAAAVAVASVSTDLPNKLTDTKQSDPSVASETLASSSDSSPHDSAHSSGLSWSKRAEWYTSKGFHVITFTFPMSEVLSYQVGGKAEQDVELLVNHLADWLEEEHGKNLVFHTFSNTGWLTYGVALEKFHTQDPSLIGRIKGCIVDSAPVASPDPQDVSSCLELLVIELISH
uniref:Uncharacterized protein n=1 Tax=Chenopodium quinoa TaxID=63459 RepID=A0A803N9A4_CHEQI